MAIDRRRNVKKESLGNRGRKVACVATLTAAGLSFGLMACGGTDTSTQASAQTNPQSQTLPDATGTTGATGSATAAGGQMPQGAPPGGPGGGMELTATQQKCLTSQGVDLPDRSSGDGTPPDKGSMPDPEEMTAAFEACDIDLPQPPSGAGGSMPQPPSSDGSASGAYAAS